MISSDKDRWSIGKSALLTDLGMCINHYRLRTVGLFACINVGVKIEEEIIYPDLIVTIGQGNSKQCSPDFENNYFVGPPNFILEIRDDFKSQAFKDRKKLFASSGVQEYFIVNEDLSKFEWNRLVDNKFKTIKPDKAGLIKSTSLPGMWIPIPALKNGDFFNIIGSIEHGLTRRDHHQLMDSIWNKE